MEPADVLADLGGVDVSRGVGGTGHPSPVSQPKSSVTLSGDDAEVAGALRKSGGSDVASLIERTGLPAAAAMRSMTSLELLGVVLRRGQYVTLTSAGMALTAAAPRPTCRSDA